MSARSSRKRSRSETEPQTETKRFRTLPPENRILESKLNEGKMSKILDFYTFGANDVGQLGVDPNEKGVSQDLVFLESIQDLNSVSYACGKDSTLVLEVNNIPTHRNVYTWGGDVSVIVRDFDEEGFLPIAVEILNQHPLIQVAAGNSHGISLTSTGEVVTWGTYKNSKGKPIGFRPRLPKDEYGLPEVMEELEDVKIIQIAATHNRSLALTETGDVFQWGNTRLDNRTIDRHAKDTLVPSPVVIAAKIVAVYAEGNGGTIFAEDADGEIWAWGDNKYYQCGIDDEVVVNPDVKDLKSAEERAATKKEKIATHSRPSKAKQINSVLKGEEVKVKKLTSGRFHSVMLTESGDVFTWGSNVKKQLGIDGVAEDEVLAVPTRIGLDEKVVDISAGPFHTLLLTESGEVYGFGTNKDKCLGNIKDTAVLPTKIPMKYKKNDLKVSGISCGSRHNLIAVERI